MPNTNEAYSRVRINSMIESAGFKLTNFENCDASVGYEGAVRNALMRTRLNEAGKRPDYHFYPPQSSTPIAFLEAKKIGGKKLEHALDQAIEYAQVACDDENPSMIVFASDGLQVRSKHGDGSELTLNNFPVDYIPPINLMEELVLHPAASQGEAVDSVKSLIEIFSSAADAMRRDGIDAGINQLREFCVLLFIKIMAERGNVEARQNWESISTKSGNNLMAEYRNVLQRYRSKYGEIFANSEINNPEILDSLISRVNPVNFTNSGIDIKGQAFEYFLSSYSAGNKSALGQYFTPRHITSLMAKLLNPQPGDRILDPFCGTGGMLISCYTQIRMNLDSSQPCFESKLKELKNHTLFGNDISGSLSGLAKMNMILLGDGQTNIKRSDSFNELELQKYDSVITNIPFNIDAPIAYEKLTPFLESSQLQGMGWNELCIVKCIESVKAGGSAAIVLPLTLCHAERYSNLRRYIANKGRVRTCIRLPLKTFVHYTTAQTAILVIDDIHKGTTDEFTFVQITSDGMSQDKNREPIPDNDIPELLECLSENNLRDFASATQLKLRGGGRVLWNFKVLSTQLGNAGCWATSWS